MALRTPLCNQGAPYEKRLSLWPLLASAHLVCLQAMHIRGRGFGGGVLQPSKITPIQLATLNIMDRELNRIIDIHQHHNTGLES